MSDRTVTRYLITLSVLGCLAVLPGTVQAEKCSSSKIKAAGKDASCLLGLESKQAKTGDPKDPAKVSACGSKLTAAFSKAEAHPPCTTTGDAGAIGTKVTAFVADIDNALSVSIPNSCQASKLKAAGKKAKCLLGLEAKEAAKGVVPDPLKQAKCRDKFAAAFAKAETAGGCTTSADVDLIEGKIDAFVADVDGTLTAQVIVCGDSHIDPNEDCDPPGSSCGGTSVCGSDCRCPCDLTNCPCDPLDPSVCLYPFPNDFFTVADASKDTGKRVNFTTVAMPANSKKYAHMVAADYNLNDGFSPGASILLHVPGIDLGMTGAAPITDIARSLDANAPIVIVNASTGAHHLMFVELDVNATDDAHRSLIIHPSINFDEGTRYIVALRNLKDSTGTIIQPGAEFLTYRDNTPGTPVQEARRPHMESLFTTLAAAGVARNDLYLAWDFTVASERNLSERLLFVRDDGFTRLGTNAPAFTVDTVTENVSTNIFRRIEGTFTVPRYVSSPTPPARFVLDANGLPTHLGTQPAPYRCDIPYAALPSAAGPAVPARASIYGHGLLGSYDEVSAGNVGDMANEHNFVFCATYWMGMSEVDVPQAIEILKDLGKFPTLTDRLQQAMLNQLYLARLMIHPDGFVSDPAFQDSAGGAVLDTSDVFYDGNSQGGIFGGTVMAVAQDITRGVLGVPGMNYSLLLTRSVDFAGYQPFLDTNYPNTLHRPLLLALIQMLWDRSDPNGYAHHMTTDPLPNTPQHYVLLHEAFGDHQVSNVATEIEARTIGASQHAPALGAGRSYEVTPLYGIPAIASYPFNGSAIVVWDSGTPTPPTTNTPNTAGSDPHSKPRSNVDARTQKSEFLKTNGAVVDVCSGMPCLAP